MIFDWNESRCLANIRYCIGHQVDIQRFQKMNKSRRLVALLQRWVAADDTRADNGHPAARRLTRSSSRSLSPLLRLQTSKVQAIDQSRSNLPRHDSWAESMILGMLAAISSLQYILVILEYSGRSLQHGSTGGPIPGNQISLFAMMTKVVNSHCCSTVEQMDYEKQKTCTW